MSGYGDPIDEDAGRPATREQADQQNTIRNENRKKVGLSYWGPKQTDDEEQRRQQQEMEETNGGPGFRHTAAYNQAQGIDGPGLEFFPSTNIISRRNRDDAPGNMVGESKFAAERRPGFTSPGDLGDLTTQKRLQEQSTPDMTGEQRHALVGKILEQQRQEAYKTATLTDDRYFENELSKWAQNYVEVSSERHHDLMDRGISGTNEYEYASDLAVEFLKGSPDKRSEFFSPVSGQMSQSLPGGKGLQEYSWDRAVATARGLSQPGQVDFMPAVEKLGSARGSLFAPSYDRTPLNKPVDSFGGRSLPAPFRSTISNVTSETIEPTGEIDLFGFRATIPFLSLFQPSVTKRTITYGQVPFAAPMSHYKSGEAAYTRTFIGSDGKPTQKMTFQEGNDLVSVDIGNQKVSPVLTTYSTGESVFDKVNRDVSDKFIKPFTPSKEAATQSAYRYLRVGDPAKFERDAPYTAAGVKFFTEMYGGVRDQPVSTALSFGVGMGVGGLFRLGSAATPMVSKVAGPTVTKGLQFVGGRAIPAAMTTVYGVDVASRSTGGFTNFKPGYVAGNLGRISGTEVMPMLAGGVIGYRSPEIAGFAYRSAVRAPGEFSNAIFSTRQRMAGIERMPHGTSTFDYSVSPGTTPSGTRGGGPAYSVMYDRLMPPRQTYGGGFSGETQFTPKPKNWEGMGKSQQMSWMKNNYREWIDVGGKRVYTMDFTRPAGRNPVFANDEAAAAFGGTRRYRPEPQRAMEPEVSAKPQSKTKYAEPFTLNIKTQQEFGGNLPAVYQRPSSPAGTTKTSLSTNFATRLNSPASSLEYERMSIFQQERVMAGAGISPYFQQSTGRATALMTNPRPSTRVSPYEMPWGDPAITPKDNRRRELVGNPLTRTITNPFTKTTTLTRPQTTTTPRPFTEPRPQPQPKREPFTEPTRTPDKPPGTPAILWPPGAGGSSGDKPFLKRRSKKWSHTNPVADMPYLSRDPFSGKKKRKSKKFPF